MLASDEIGTNQHHKTIFFNMTTRRLRLMQRAFIPRCYLLRMICYLTSISDRLIRDAGTCRMIDTNHTIICI